MSDEEDDYLSDKFLIESTTPQTSSSKTYSQIRKDAQKRAALKNEQNRKKSQKEIREEGLSKSLFERAKEEEPSSGGNKALMMMMKMGFKPGQALGRLDGDSENKGTPRDDSEARAEESNAKESEEDGTSGTPVVESNLGDTSSSTEDVVASATTTVASHRPSGHRTEPIPLNEWAGRQGIGTSRRLKRGPSPTSEERVAKMAKMAANSAKAQDDFRQRTRIEYEERRAEGRLGPTQRTCVTLDEKAGKQFNVLWLNPGNVETFPPGLLHALDTRSTYTLDHVSTRPYNEDSLSLATRLRKEMQSDALSPLSHDYTQVETSAASNAVDSDFSQSVLDEVTQFLRLQARDRLDLVLTYLRDEYAYCFWCGTQYENQDQLADQCPGVDEESHD
ncbi:hypothetical protein V5O48_000037 [Marasmius crinis-equi]|uniref:DUF4187 domain-containing protein n=1 Tax=Marasmius crinis-equi TaxID=585013 RepID=A0ABR3G2D8_9AGAR